MKDIMLQTIDNLKEKVKKNLYEIQNNQQSIRYWLKQPDSEQRSAELETKYALNKELLNENNDFINVQLTLTSFLERYKDTNVLQTHKGPAIVKFKNEDECFECTINGQLTYNENHPYYENEGFFQKLLLYFQRIEDYENCLKLVNIKKTKQTI